MLIAFHRGLLSLLTILLLASCGLKSKEPLFDIAIAEPILGDGATLVDQKGEPMDVARFGNGYRMTASPGGIVYFIPLLGHTAAYIVESKLDEPGKPSAYFLVRLDEGKLHAWDLNMPALAEELSKQGFDVKEVGDDIFVSSPQAVEWVASRLLASGVAPNEILTIRGL